MTVFALVEARIDTLEEHKEFPASLNVKPALNLTMFRTRAEALSAQEKVGGVVLEIVPNDLITKQNKHEDECFWSKYEERSRDKAVSSVFTVAVYGNRPKAVRKAWAEELEQAIGLRLTA